jgi:predicted RNA-binding Zn-ribbon protein involved in translation (DUF1610 family)
MCLYCGSALPQGKIHFRDLCPDCGKELHICRHCRFYKPGVYRDCTETVPEEVTDKERRNFCEYFSALAALPPRAEGKAKDARGDFEGLFG